LRIGVFHRELLGLAEKPCILTITIVSTGSQIRVSGVLRAYYSLSSLHGWALVPPQQHGGFASLRLMELNIAAATQRDVVFDGHGRRLRYCSGSETVFELERDNVLFTAPPRTTRSGRYLYVGGRRRQSPEPWMLR
jgi:hypothetical protein